MQKFRVLFFEILIPLVYCFNRGCFCTEFWVEMQIIRLLFFEIHGTLVYYFNRPCFFSNLELEFQKCCARMPGHENLQPSGTNVRFRC